MFLSQNGFWVEGLTEWSEDCTVWRFLNLDGYLAAERMFHWYREGDENSVTRYETDQNTGLAAEIEVLRWQQNMTYQYSPVFDYPYGVAAKEYGIG